MNRKIKGLILSLAFSCVVFGAFATAPVTTTGKCDSSNTNTCNMTIDGVTLNATGVGTITKN